MDTLKKVGIEPDGMIGHSVGELVCGYADKCLTKSQTVLAAYWRGRSIKKASVIEGAMAAIGEYLIINLLHREIEILVLLTNTKQS